MHSVPAGTLWSSPSLCYRTIVSVAGSSLRDSSNQLVPVVEVTSSHTRRSKSQLSEALRRSSCRVEAREATDPGIAGSAHWQDAHGMADRRTTPHLRSVAARRNSVLPVRSRCISQAITSSDSRADGLRKPVLRPRHFGVRSHSLKISRHFQRGPSIVQGDYSPRRLLDLLA